MKKEQNEKYYTVHEIWKEKMIPWVKTYKTLLKYVSEEHIEIFKPMIRDSAKGISGTRYFVSETNLNEFIKRSKENSLYTNETTQK